MKLKVFILLLAVLTFLNLTNCKKNNDNKSDKNTISEEKFETFEGYLMDVSCGKKEIALDKTNTVFSPQDHTVECLSVCYSSGYGIMIKETDKNSYKFIPFNTEAKDLAYDIVKNTKKKSGISISVTGKYENDMITVKSITEVL